MTRKTKTNITEKIANSFGSVGYFFCTLQWLWSTMLYFSLIESFTNYITPVVETEEVVQISYVVDKSPDASLMVIAGIITVIIIIITIYALIKTPSTVVKASKTVVHGTATAVTPIVMRVQHRKIEDKVSRRKITSRLIILLKILLVIIPIILAFTSAFLEVQKIDYSIAIYASIWLASFSIIFFALQYIMARLFSIKNKEIY